MQRDEEHRDTILEATVEHQVAEDLIEQLSRARAKGTPEWRAKCTVLKEMLEHHIEEEEGEVFQAAREMFEQEQLEEMAQKFERLKERELKAA
jgi:hemerythrin-like domain-containing protein